MKTPLVEETTLRHLSFSKAVAEFASWIDSIEYDAWLREFERKHPESKSIFFRAAIFGMKAQDMGVVVPPTKEEWLLKHPAEEDIVEWCLCERQKKQAASGNPDASDKAKKEDE